MKWRIAVVATLGMVIGAAGVHAQRVPPPQTTRTNPPTTTDNTAQAPQEDSTQTQPRRSGWGQFRSFHSFTALR